MFGLGLYLDTGVFTRGGSTAILRGQRMVYMASASSLSLTLPTGSLAGDMCIIIATQGFNASFPSGWVPLTDLRAPNWKGVIYHKTLTSADITAGNVSIGWTGTYSGNVACVTAIGNIGIRSVVVGNNNSGASSRSLTSDANPVSGDCLLLYGSSDANGAVTSSSLATVLASDTQVGASALLEQGYAASGGAQSATVNYAGSPTGDFQTLIALTQAAVSTLYTNTGGTGNRSASITVTATSIAAGAGSAGDTVDGTQTDSYWWTNATGDGTAWLTFDFGSGASVVIDQFRMYQSIYANTHGVWRFEGSNNNSTWAQCGVDFTLQGWGAIPVPNTAGYRYYRLRHMSGSRSQTPFIREFEFKIA